MCSASSRAKRTSLPKETSRTKCISRSAQAEHIVQKQKALLSQCFLFLKAPPGIEPGIKVLQTSALPLGYGAAWSGLRGSNSLPPPWQGGALPDELNPQIWCLRSESNQRHEDFQSSALPTELQRHTARAVFFKNGDPDGGRTHDL